jgi:hypothetical protein
MEEFTPYLFPTLEGGDAIRYLFWQPANGCLPKNSIHDGYSVMPSSHVRKKRRLRAWAAAMAAGGTGVAFPARAVMGSLGAI